ncbi:MAG: hypothetical protein QM811_04350 [Pirellulales bacterium]
MGPTGRNVIINKSFGGPTVTKDGVTVSKEIDSRRPFREHGRQAGQRSRQQDQRHRRRRHHDRDRFGPRDLQGRDQTDRRRIEPDGRAPRDRKGR